MPDLTPDLDAIRERLEDVCRPTLGLIAWSELRGLHFMANTSTIAPERGERLVQAIAAAPTDVAALMAEVQRLTLLWDKTCANLGAAREEADRLRPMEAALAAARELHTPIDNTWPLYPGDGSCCTYCCVDGHGGRTAYCRARCDASTACWPCPTRTALDGGA